MPDERRAPYRKVPSAARLIHEAEDQLIVQMRLDDGREIIVYVLHTGAKEELNRWKQDYGRALLVTGTVKGFV